MYYSKKCKNKKERSLKFKMNQIEPQSVSSWWHNHTERKYPKWLENTIRLYISSDTYPIEKSTETTL